MRSHAYTLARAAAAPHSAGLAEYLELAKPRITTMVAATAWVGCELGRLPGQAVPWVPTLAAVTGTALACASAGVFNQVIERDSDALMHRTRHRPLPTGRISVAAASLYGWGLASAALLILATFTNALAALLAALTIGGYLFIYTPLKRRAGISTLVGAVPGAMPPVIGYAAVTGTLAIPALAVFAIMFLWQLPHFLAIAWLYREDYARAGMPMLPVIDPSGASTFRQMVVGCMALLPVGLWPAAIGLAGAAYFWGALALGLVFLATGLVLVVRRSTRWARVMFYTSLVYLPGILGLLLVNRG